MAGYSADEGITGTSARKRPEFLKMVRQCKQGKIDVVLAKSISRFARNTVDCLNYIRALKALGIAVIFEKENINTLETDSEILITMMGAFAQAESESISANVRWGKRQAMREGKVSFQYTRLYGYKGGRTANRRSSRSRPMWFAESSTPISPEPASGRSRPAWSQRASHPPRANMSGLYPQFKEYPK